MPNLNGYEVCKILKASDKTKNIPIIFITARSSETDEEKGLDLGAIDYVTKPFSKTIVKLRIRNHIKLKEKTNLLEQLSMYDSLTNIKNRRFFDEIFEKIKDKEWIGLNWIGLNWIGVGFSPFIQIIISYMGFSQIIEQEQGFG